MDFCSVRKRRSPPSPFKMLCMNFREANVNNVAAECDQIIQILDINTGICYELLKHISYNSIIVHYSNGDAYIIKQYTDKNITLENAIKLLRLSLNDFELDERDAHLGLERMLQTKVKDLPLLQGTIKFSKPAK
jgi:hypothetical protein